MNFSVITLFPELVMAVAAGGVTGRALERGLLDVQCVNPREFTTDVHRTVDDRPYGGGPGMVMKPDCLLQSVRKVRQQNAGKVVYLSPQGKPFDQPMAESFAEQGELILLCGRYEGIDERVVELEVDLECSIGDYVLSGGELGAMVIIDAVARLIPGVLGHHDSANQDSFSSGLLDCPHYTRPEEIEGLSVPEVLKGGNHAQIDRWRKKQALGRTWQRRPELLNNDLLTQVELNLLEEYKQEH